MARAFGSQEFVAALLLLLPSLNVVFCGKLLVVPMDGSHWLSMQPVLNQLKQNGHELVIVAPEVNVHIKASDETYTWKTYPVPFTKQEMEEHFKDFTNGVFEDLPFITMFLTTYQRMKKTSALFMSSCVHLLYNKELMTYLEQSKFDALFTDPMMPCGQIVAEHLDVPSVFFLRGIPCGLDSAATQCPTPPSYVPRIFSRNSDRMTFVQRVKNMLLYTSEFFLCSAVYSPYSSLASEFLQRDATITEFLSHGSVWLMRTDFTNDYPKPLMPNMVLIGGINCAGKKPLSQVCDSCYSLEVGIGM